MAENLKSKILSGLIWNGMERFSFQIIGFVLSVVMARLLTVEQFGVIAIINIFIIVFSTAIDSGLGMALIQKKDADQTDFSTIFFFNIIMSIVMYGILFAAAPCIASFYNDAAISSYLRVLSLIFIINGLSIVQNACMRKNMLFKLGFRISLTALLLSGSVGVFCAYKGCGVWTLVIQQITSSVTSCLLYWIVIKWHPLWKFDIKRLRGLFRYSWKLMSSGYIGIVVGNLSQAIIGKLYNMESLAIYNRGHNIPQLGTSTLSSTVGTVLFPALSKIQDDKEKFINLADKCYDLVIFAILPILTLLFICAEDFILIVYSAKWLVSTEYVRYFCIFFLFFTLTAFNQHILLAQGRSDYNLYFDIIKHVQILLGILFSFQFGMRVLALCLSLLSILELWETAFFIRKILPISSFAVFRKLLPYSIIVGGGIAGTYFLNRVFHLNQGMIRLFIDASFFAVLYVVATFFIGRVSVVSFLKEVRSDS